MHPRLTLKSVRVRPVVVPLRRPIVSKVGLFEHWPIILIDRSYLEPYLTQSMR
jgi:mandelate racemase